MNSLIVPGGDAIRGGTAECDVEAGGAESSILGQKRGRCDTESPGDSQSCGICLAEVDDQGLLDSCQHAYCFDCIMKWSQVESRCPTCKRRFHRVTRTMMEGAGRRGSLSRPRSFRIPVKDQVYQPSAEDLAAYANTVCMVCLESDNEHLLLLCDVCDGAAHTYCVGLGRQVPEGDWFCATCTGADDGATSGSDASVGEEELGESSDSGAAAEEAQQGRHPGGIMSDEDNDTEFRLEIQFDSQPARATATRQGRRLRSASRTVQGPQGGAGAADRGRRATRRRGIGLREQLRVSSVPSLDGGGAVGASGRNGWREGRVGDRVAASARWGGGTGFARTLQAQVQDALQLRLMRERWPAIRQGTLHFPSPSHPAPPPQAGPPAASKPKDGAGSESERMAWKALRALQSGEGAMLGDTRVQGGAGPKSRARAAKKEEGKGIRGRAAPKISTVAERPRGSSRKELTRSHNEARDHIEQRTGNAGQQTRAQQRRTADEDGAGGQAAVGALAAFAEARRQANAGWVDEEVLQGLREGLGEGPSNGGQRKGSKSKTSSAHGARLGITPHGSWARRPPSNETAPTRRVSHSGEVPAGWPACTQAGGPAWSAAGAAGQPNWRREWHSGPPWAQVAPASSGGSVLGASKGRAWIDMLRPPSSLADSRPARLPPPSLPGEIGSMAPGTPPPLWPRSPVAEGASCLPAPLLPSSCLRPAPAVPSTAAAPHAAGPSTTPDVGQGAWRPSPEIPQAGVKESGEGVATGEVLPKERAALAGGANTAGEVGAHQVLNRAAGGVGASNVGEGGHGMEAAKRVKDELAEAVKRQLAPLYKRKVIDKEEFRKAAVGASRALLQMPSAQAHTT
ncbi:Zinc finger RING-type domain containing protein [Klebsormidium nitens]|uniref:Zinc finger RING-type domain containing protein n=1 Tax=Klebsormidium nitens TaxID=105231 RepID=A0A1Y1IBM1_KLENI|nr:Zinc finger RING-type domain containing protein [Klebsormidium nitens]|eukprot:GAQ86106.1 Zinc finger RING-type domain containing protein [Klebsormidium nitens]